jgi:hypothetical protein
MPQWLTGLKLHLEHNQHIRSFLNWTIFKHAIKADIIHEAEFSPFTVLLTRLDRYTYLPIGWFPSHCTRLPSFLSLPCRPIPLCCSPLAPNQIRVNSEVELPLWRFIESVSRNCWRWQMIKISVPNSPSISVIGVHTLPSNLNRKTRGIVTPDSRQEGTRGLVGPVGFDLDNNAAVIHEASEWDQIRTCSVA